MYSAIASSAEALTVSNSSVGFTTVPASATRAIVVVKSQPLRFWVDGSTPTTVAGMYANDDYIIYLYKSEITKFRAIREGGTDAVANVTFYEGGWPDGIDYEANKVV